MKTPIYREALRHGWDLVWKYKFLWVFGMFAAFLGQMGLLDILSKIGLTASGSSLSTAGALGMSGWWQIATQAKLEWGLPIDTWIWFIWLMVTIIGLVICFVFASVVSQGAIIHATARSMASLRSIPDIGEAWHMGVKNFGNLFILNFIKKTVICILSATAGWATINVMLGMTGFSLFLFILLIVLALVVGMVLSFLVVYAAGYVVVEKYSFGKAIVASWELFLSHWLVSIEVAAIVLALNIVVSLIALLGFFIIFLPTLISWFVAVMTVNVALWQAGFIVGVLLFTLFAIFIGSIFTVFITSIWTYLFMKMHHLGIESRILHCFGLK